MFEQLPRPARYFPIEKGIYEVAPGLKNLGHPLGNGDRDGLVFQLDSEFPRYRESKLGCRAERLSKYLGTVNYTPDISTAVNGFLIRKLTEEHPKFFRWDDRSRTLHCALTDESLTFDEKNELVSSKTSVSPPYASAFDALCSQIQEDVAVMTAREGRDWLSALHLCSPSHWAAEEKLGKSFFSIHVPVPGIEKMNRAASAFVDAMIRKGPYVRFVWAFSTDNRLNHHPEPPSGHTASEWKGRTFARDRPGSPFILRLERQVLCSLPEVDSGLFFIRTYFIDGEEIRSNPRERDLLRSGLLSMTPESRRYKGLAECMDQVIEWLDAAN